MPHTKFEYRHIGPNKKQIETMLAKIGASSLDALIEETIPAAIRLKKPLAIGEAVSEYEYLVGLKELGKKNKIYKSLIGLGYNNCVVPPVIQRNILENPGWYTAYTPYQAEIAQGRLEALLNFQTMVMDLTGMEIANASLLDEATAAAEAMIMFYNNRSRDAVKKNVHQFFVSKDCFPQTIALLQTRSAPLGIELVIADHTRFEFTEAFFGGILQYPDVHGKVADYSSFVNAAHAQNASIVVAADLLSLALLTPPGEWGADVVVGNSQRFGVPMGYGGPHAAFFATKEEFKRILPGRIIGVSVDSHGNRALRMALQTREQHIRRDKATSNICTAQALLAIMAGMFAVYHGPSGIKSIAQRVNSLCCILAEELKKLGYTIEHEIYFDTLKIIFPNTVTEGTVHQLAIAQQYNFRFPDSTSACISLDETSNLEDVSYLVNIFAQALQKAPVTLGSKDLQAKKSAVYNSIFERKTSYLTHPIFNSYHSETELMRYIKRLENKDLSLTHSMISLGSCTMKLNAAAELIPITWAEFAYIHPFAPIEQTEGYQQIFVELEKMLCEITGFAAMSFQPNSGAQGEYAGLLVIREYHISRGDTHRTIALIPSSAHGTNPASAAMAGMQIIVVKCDDNGNIDISDLKQKAELYKEKLSCLMVTYPSTHGVYEEGIIEITDIIHQNGGQVYMDGANMNAQVGLTSPGNIGADVCHLNLHKTFAIPHGGGGPGMGPIGVAAHLKPFLPSHPLVKTGGDKGIKAVSAAPWGSSLILLISYAYCKMLGAEGLTNSTKMAILNANYIKETLKDHYSTLYTGKNGRCAHEMILDCAEFKKTAQIEVADIAKRLMDYGFHAPTVSFPVHDTIMVEPTESESLDELNRFCQAMISIRMEIDEIANGKADAVDNVIKNAPHTGKEATADSWSHSYTRQKAVYPLNWVVENKFWPSVGRIDNAFGDRNLICSCPSIESYAEELIAN